MGIARLLAIVVLLAAPCFGQSMDSPITRMVPVEQLFRTEFFTYDRSDISAGDYESICRVVSNGGVGTGVYLSAGLVLTANHVVEGESETWCEFRQQRIKVKDRWNCKHGTDIALMLLEEVPDVPEQKLATRPMQVGDLVYLAGFDRGQPDTLRLYDGRVHAVHGQTTDVVGVESRIAIGGNSGGPVWNDRGEIVSSISTRCPPGTPISSNGRVVGHTEIGTTGMPSSQHVFDFVRRVSELRGEETGEQIIGGLFRRGRVPPQTCPDCEPAPRPQPRPQPSPSPQPSQPCECDEEAIAARVLDSINLEGIASDATDAATAAALNEIRNDPKYEGPKGDDGDSPEIDYDRLADEVTERMGPSFSREDAMALIAQVLIESGSHEMSGDSVRVKPIWMRRVNGRTDELIKAEPIYPGDGFSFKEHPGVVAK